MSNSILRSTTRWVESSGEGENIKHAMESAFKEMRKTIGTTFDKPIISMRTEDVVLINSSKEDRTEAFFFFFSKRQKVIWNIQVKIKLAIDYIEFEEE